MRGVAIRMAKEDAFSSGILKDLKREAMCI